MPVKNPNKIIRVSVALLGLMGILLAVSAVSAHYNAIWRWEVNQPDGGSQVQWNSPFEDNQTEYSMFPSDTRQRLRSGYYQWDDALNPNSDLTIDETSSWTQTEHETHPIDFDSLDYDDIPGWFVRIPDSGTTVEYSLAWLNTDWDWNTEENNRANREADVQTVLVHEFGHSSGFRHPCFPASSSDNDCDPSTVMAIILNGTKRTLTQHDRDSVASKY